MIKVSVFYPNGPDAKFDMQYYVTHHLPMVRERCGAACRGIAAESGVVGGAPGSKPQYIAIGHLTFETVEAFQKAFGPHAGEIMADVPKYTNTQPVIQISEVAL